MWPSDFPALLSKTPNTLDASKASLSFFHRFKMRWSGIKWDPIGEAMHRPCSAVHVQVGDYSSLSPKKHSDWVNVMLLCLASQSTSFLQMDWCPLGPVAEEGTLYTDPFTANPTAQLSSVFLLVCFLICIFELKLYVVIFKEAKGVIPPIFTSLE